MARFLDAWYYSGADLDFLARLVSVWIPLVAFRFLTLLLDWFGAPAVLGAYGLALLGALILWLRIRRRWPLYAVLGVGIFYLALPLLGFEMMSDEAIPLLLWNVVVVAIVFGIPTTMLGALTPLWRQFDPLAVLDTWDADGRPRSPLAAEDRDDEEELRPILG